MEVRVGGLGELHATTARQRLLGRLQARTCVAGMPRVTWIIRMPGSALNHRTYGVHSHRGSSLGRG